MKTLAGGAGWFLATTACVNAGSAAAHHSWSAEYDLSRSTYVSGTVASVAFRNPHSAFVLVVDADDGRQERWIVEWASLQRLLDRGVTNETLRVGDALLVTRNPHRDAKVKSVRAVSVRSSDGTEIGRDNRAGG